VDGDRFVLDLDRVERAIDRNTRLLIVNSPSNPTGWVVREDEQRALYDLAVRRDLTILADEVYERLVFGAAAGAEADGPHVAPSFARVAEERERLIVVNSFSKTYNMTGWRLGWAQSSERVIRQMYKAAEFMTSNPAAMAQQAGIVALRDGEPYVDDLRRHYTARRTQALDALAKLGGVSVPEPEGAFYAFARVQGLEDSAAFALALLRSSGVALAPGSAFGPGGEGHLRLCFAASEATLEEALARITASWQPAAP
jgi:aspartate/methionine/tyrosine aminotransferase